MKRSVFSIITALALCLSLCPTRAFAAEADPSLCRHHPEHTDGCGYIAPSEGQPCQHEHTEDCFTAEEDGMEVPDCQHEHDEACGYVPEEPGQPCAYVCPLYPIENLLNALPAVVTEDNREEVETRLQEILGLYGDLTAEEQDQVDISRCQELLGQMDEASVPVPLADYSPDVPAGETRAENPSGSAIGSVHGTLTKNNGTVNTIYSGGVADNHGQIILNKEGTVASNYGTIVTNSALAPDDHTPKGVSFNYGRISTNLGTVSYNEKEGKIENNSGNGIVEENYGYVRNQGGTVTYNNSGGIVLLESGTVENNRGTVYVTESLGKINDNRGTVCWRLTTDGTNKEAAELSNQTTYLGNTYIQDGCVITAKDNYRFKTDPVVSGASITKNEDGSYTVSGITASVTITLDMEQICKHENVPFEDQGDGTHSGTCPDCGRVITGSHTWNDESKCTGCDIARPKAAQVGDTIYETIEEAWAAAQAAGTAKVILLADTKVSNPLEVKDGQDITLTGNYTLTGNISIGLPVIKVSGGTLTIDGAKVSITGQSGDGVSVQGGEVVIKDGSAITTTGSTHGVFVSSGGTLTVTGGAFHSTGYSSGLLVSNGTASISGGTFSADDDTAAGLYYIDGSLTLTGGSFSGKQAVRMNTVSQEVRTLLDKSGNASGTCYAYFRDDGSAVTEGLDSNILAGPVTVRQCPHKDSMGAAPLDSIYHKVVCLACGWTNGITEEHTWGSGGCTGCGQPTNRVLVETQNSRVGYTDIVEAWNAAKAAQTATVTLLADLEITAGLKVEPGEKITFNGGDYTLSNKVQSQEINPGVNSNVLEVDGGELIINSGTLSSDAGNVVSVDRGSATITGGTLTTGRSTGYSLYVGRNNPSVTISGGAFSGKGNGVVTYSKDLTISGGSFSVTNSAVKIGETGVSSVDCTVGDLLDKSGFDQGIRYFYYRDGKPVKEGLDEKSIEGNVAVKACEHDFAYTPTEGETMTHSKSCSICEYSLETDPCTFTQTEAPTAEQHTGQCQGCGREWTGEHSFPDPWAADGTRACTVCGYKLTAAVKVEANSATTYYGGIDTAWAAAKAAGTATLTLLANVDITNQLELESGNITFYGGDCIWSNSGNDRAVKISDGSLTIASGTIKGRITAISIDGGRLEIIGGRIEAEQYYGIDATGGTVRISGGEIIGGSSGLGIGAGRFADVKISGGTISCSKTAISTASGNVSTVLPNYGATTEPHYAFHQDGKPYPLPDSYSLPGGTYTVEECSHDADGIAQYQHIDGTQTHTITCLACGHLLETEPCTFTQTEAPTAEQHTGQCQECGGAWTGAHSFSAEWAADGTRACTVCDYKLTAAAKVEKADSETVYVANLTDAFAAGNTSAVVTLLSDVTWSGGAISLPANTSFTLELNNKTITNEGNLQVFNLSNTPSSLTVEGNGSIIAKKHHCIWVQSGASLTVKGGTIQTEGNSYHGICVGGGTANIYDGSEIVSQKNADTYAALSVTSGTANVYGGTFTGGVSRTGSGVLNLSGGTFRGVYADGVSVATYNGGALRDLLDKTKNEDGTYYAYSKGDAVITEGLDGDELTGTVTVTQCEHEKAAYIDKGDGTHSLTCPACGYSVTENCTYGTEYGSDDNNHWQICTFCGYEKAEAHTFTCTATPEGYVIAVSGVCDKCSNAVNLGTVTLNIPELTYGATKDQPVTWEIVSLSDTLTLKAPMFIDDSGIKKPYSNSYPLPELAAGKHTLSIAVPIAKKSSELQYAECSVTFTVAKATLTPSIDASGGTTTKTYDGKEDAPDGLAIGLTGIVGSDDVTATATSCQYNSRDVDKATTITASGITLSGNDSGNYELSGNTAEISGTITPAAVALTFSSQTITYGGKPAPATADPAGAVIEYSYTTSADGESVSGWPANAGTYTVTAKVEANGNYGAASETATLIINKAEHENVLAETSCRYGLTKTYDMADLLPEGHTLGTITTSDSNGIFEGEITISGTTLTYKLVNDAEKASKSGDIIVPVTSSTNYNDFVLTITVNVEKVQIPDLTVNPIRVTYTGQPVPDSSISGTATVDGQTITGKWSFLEEQNITNVADSGTKHVTFTPEDTNGYGPNTGTVTVTIDPAKLTLTASTHSITLGNALPAYSYTVTGLVNGEEQGAVLDPSTVTVSSAADGKTAGQYAVTVTGGTLLSDNYTLEYQEGKLTITKPADPPPTVITVKGVRLNRSTQTLEVGELFRLTATVDPANATESTDVTWSSSNPTVADVDSSGNVIALKPGTAKITVRTVSRGYTAECTITVEAPKPETYTISYEANGGTGTVANGTATENEPFTLPQCGFTPPDGKVFDVWAIGSLSGEKAAAGSSHTFTIDTTVYAIWKEKPEEPAKTYTITYAANGGTGTIAAGTARENDPFTLPECGFTAPEGKEFAGWSIGGTSGVIIEAGGSYTFSSDTVIYAVWKDIPAETCTITYNANGGSGTMAAATATKNVPFTLPECGFTPPAGKMFDTWRIGGTSGTSVKPGERYTFTADTVIRAIWKDAPIDPVYAITGNVLYHDGAGVPNAAVTLMRGTKIIAKEQTDTNGRFTFSGVPIGEYNLKAEKADITKTVKQEITSGSTNLTITLPAGKENSVLVVEAGAPAVVVGGLDEVFKDTSVYTPEDKEIVNDGGSVEFELVVEKQDTPPEAAQIEAVKKEKETVALYLNLTLTKTVTRTDGTETSSGVSELGTLIETIIPLPAEMQGKASYTVYRVHDGKAEPLPQNTGDEYYTVSSDKTTISIFARKYSIYAIAWSDTDTTTPTTPSVTPSRPSSGGGDGNSSVKTYAITVEKSEHGKVTLNRTSAASGTTITLTVTPDVGYVLLDMIVTNSQGNKIALTEKNTFTMPASAVTVTARFTPIPDESLKQPCDGGADCPSGAYTDLSTGTWYHEAVDYAIREGLLTGYGDGTFNPNGTLSRAMLAQILYNMEGRPSVSGGSSFLDVAPDSWYANAITWAAAQGIVGGYGNGMFGPNDSITREQLAVMLWRYNREPATTDKQLHFSDADRASGWALEALRWAAQNGVLNGRENGILDPTGTASRAETAQMFRNLADK